MVRDNYSLKLHKYVCITIYQPDAESNPNPNPNPNLNYLTARNSEHSTKYSRMSYESREIYTTRDMLLHRPCDFRL